VPVEGWKQLFQSARDLMRTMVGVRPGIVVLVVVRIANGFLV
jgi:hypothetical protein